MFANKICRLTKNANSEATLAKRFDYRACFSILFWNRIALRAVVVR